MTDKTPGKEIWRDIKIEMWNVSTFLHHTYIMIKWIMIAGCRLCTLNIENISLHSSMRQKQIPKMGLKYNLTEKRGLGQSLKKWSWSFNRWKCWKDEKTQKNDELFLISSILRHSTSHLSKFSRIII